jgi:hypothetical protein
MLFVGLGGSGGKTLRFMKAGLVEWLNRHGWDGGIPTGFQFVHIDTPTEPDGKDVGDSSLISSEEYLGLVGKGIAFEAVADNLDNGPSPHLDLAGWRVEPANLMVSIQAGAGQYRAVGRSIGAAYLPQIRDFLRQAIARINDVKAQPELNKLYAHVTKTSAESAGAGGKSEPFVVIVSSLAGGTGAGIFMDTCDTLRLLEPTWGHHSFALLYTPEVFTNIPTLQRGGVEPNSLAAICELTNGSWFQQGSDASACTADGTELAPLEARLPGFFKKAGFAKGLKKSGPAYPFLIGLRSSRGAAYQDDRELFRMVGQSMVAWATDAVMQDGLLAYVKANWMNAAGANSPDGNRDILVNTGAGEQGVPNISGIGFARISIGTRQFEEYAARRIAHDAAKWISRYHTNSEEAQAIQGDRKAIAPEQLATEIAERHFDWFISQCKLQERGPERNDILNALEPAGIEQLQKNLRAKVKASIKNIEAQPARSWDPEINTAINNHLKDYEHEWKVSLNAAFEGWVKSAPERVLSVVREAVANFGTAVAAKLVAQLIHELSNESDGVAVELLGKNELGQYAQWSSREFWGKRLSTALVEAGGGKVESDDPAIEKAINDSLSAARFSYKVPTCERAALMLKEFCSGFLRPLQRKLGDVTDDLRKQIREVSNWPGWPEPGETQEVPDDLKPGAAERTLLDVEKFPELFTTNLAIHFGRDMTQDAQSKRDVRQDVISGKFIDKRLSESSKHTSKLLPLVAIQITGEWRPSSTVIGGARAADAVRLDVRYSVYDLLDRARAWLNDGDGVFPQLLRSNLRDFTDFGDTFDPAFGMSREDYVARRARFIEIFETAIGLSDPLVGLDPQLTQQLHPRATSPIRRFSSIPFGGDHKLKTVVLEKIASEMQDNQAPDPQQLLSEDASLTHIDLYSFLPAPHSPLVIRSLMEPIGQAWAPIEADGSRAAVAISNFWFYRRTRPLLEFIPAPRPHIHAMVRGWFVGHLLGLIDVRQKAAVRIVDTEDENLNRYSFPYPTLSPPEDDNLAAILESLALAYVRVGVDDDIEPLYPYVLLRRLGTSTPGRSLTYWGELNDLCRTWLRDGVVRGSQREQMLVPDVASEGMSAEQRGQLVVDRLKSEKEVFARDYRIWKRATDDDASRLGQLPLWPGMWQTIERSLTQLITTFAAERAEKAVTRVR